MEYFECKYFQITTTDDKKIQFKAQLRTCKLELIHPLSSILITNSEDMHVMCMSSFHNIINDMNAALMVSYKTACSDYQ